MKKNYLWIIAALIIIGVGYYIYWKTHQQTAQVQYVTQPAQKGALVSSVSASGNVIVQDQSNIDPIITGTVANLAVNIGDRVTVGQFLFDIVNDQLAVTASQALTDFKNAQSTFESAKSQEEAAEAKLVTDKKALIFTHSQRIADLKNIDAAEAAKTSAQQAINSAATNLNFARQQAGKRHVVSPITGTVNAVNINNGDDLGKLASGSSRTVPIIIGDLSTMKAQVQVNEVDIPNVQIGKKATMTFDAIQGLNATGKVEKMDSLGTLVQGVVTYNVTIGFDNLNPLIKPEMSVAANIITDVRQDVIIVPSSAVKIQGTQTYVEILNTGEKISHRQNVQVGASNNTDTEIVSGVNVGDNVVTQTISPNATVSAPSATGGLPGVGGGRGGIGGRLGG